MRIFAKPTNDQQGATATSLDSGGFLTGTKMPKEKRKKGASVGRKIKYLRHEKSNLTGDSEVPRQPDPGGINTNRQSNSRPNVSSEEDFSTPWHRRIAIAHFFLEEGAPYPSDWYGDNGTIATIRKKMGLPSTTRTRETIKNVFDEVSYCLMECMDYDGFSKAQKKAKGRAPVMSLDDKFIINLVARSVEEGFGLRNTTRLVNEHKSETGEELVSLSAVYGLVQRMKPTNVKISKRQQGSFDSESTWAKASFAWALQLLIRFQEIDLSNLSLETPEFRNAVSKIVPDSMIPPDYFDKTKVSKLDLSRVLWFDEHHRQVRVGTDGLKCECQTLFPRDEDGNIDLSPNGKYKRAKKKLAMKYAEEGRWMLGMVLDGTSGKVLQSFDYTLQTIIMHDAYEKKMQEEIDRVKATCKKSAYWVESSRNGRIWADDDLTLVNGVGKAIKEKLLKNNINTCCELFNLSDEAVLLISLNEHKDLRISRAALQKMKNAVVLCLDPKPDPMVKDHTKAANPYESKFGPTWEAKITTSIGMKRYRSIIELATHMVEEGKKLFPDRNFHFYHDALSLLSAEKTQKEMDARGLLRHWILPELGLNAGTRYARHPTGNRPELMPWDCSCNADIVNAVFWNCTATSHLKEDDGRKMKMTTPREISKSYLKVLGGIPLSKRITEDVLKVVQNSLRKIVEAEGALVPGLGNHAGRRGGSVQALGINRSNWGGSRKKGEGKLGKTMQEMPWLCPDAKEALKEKVSNLKASLNSSDGGNVSSELMLAEMVET
jgi:predicted flap endonuclease-1-like 5' DNA nuclease